MKHNNFSNAEKILLTVISQSQQIYKSVKILGQLILLSIVLLGMSVSNVAQQGDLLPARHPNEFADDKPKKCFEYDLSLDLITQNTPADKTIIVIARLGDKDTKADLNKRRLHNIYAYWTQYLTAPIRRNPETVVLAEGETVKGFGQVEFYVRGELVEVLKLVPNGDFPTALCYILPDEDLCSEEKRKIFYPCKDQLRKQMPKRKIKIVKKSTNG